MDKLLAQLDARSLQMLAIGLCLVLVVVIATRGVVPQVKKWQSQQQSVRVLETVRSGQDDVQTQMAGLQAEIAAIRKNMRGDLPEMPLQQLESYIIGRFQVVSWSSDMDLLSVRPGINQNMKRFDEISFDVEISGSYPDLFRWLWALGHELGFVVVKNFQITPTSHGETNPKLLARLNIVFYQPEDVQ